MFSRWIPPLRQTGAAILLLFFARDAWAISVSPSPSYNGSYTVSWSTALGCIDHNDPPFYTVECWTLYENGVEVSQSGYSLSVSGKPVGTYQYEVYYIYYVYGTPYSANTVEGPITQTVLTPTDAYFTIDDVSATEGNTLTFTVTKYNSNAANVGVSFTTVDSAAVAGSDYYATSGSLTFTPTETTKTITVSRT